MNRKAIVGLAAAAVITLWAAVDPFSGFWRLNLAKSRLPPPLPRSQSTNIEVTGEAIHIREDIEMEKGERMVITVDARFDGKDYPIHGSPFADTVAYERVNVRTFKGTVKKAGRVITNETVVVSADGKTLAGTYSGIDATGKTASGTAIFERQ
jgi:hypothetical protein